MSEAALGDIGAILSSEALGSVASVATRDAGLSSAASHLSFDKMVQRATLEPRATGLMAAEAAVKDLAGPTRWGDGSHTYQAGDLLPPGIMICYITAQEVRWIEDGDTYYVDTSGASVWLRGISLGAFADAFAAGSTWTRVGAVEIDILTTLAVPWSVSADVKFVFVVSALARNTDKVTAAWKQIDPLLRDLAGLLIHHPTFARQLLSVPVWAGLAKGLLDTGAKEFSTMDHVHFFLGCLKELSDVLGEGNRLKPAIAVGRAVLGEIREFVKFDIVGDKAPAALVEFAAQGSANYVKGMRSLGVDITNDDAKQALVELYSDPGIVTTLRRIDAELEAESSLMEVIAQGLKTGGG